MVWTVPVVRALLAAVLVAAVMGAVRIMRVRRWRREVDAWIPPARWDDVRDEPD